MISMMHFLILEYIIRHEDVKHEVLTPEIFRSALKTAIIGPVCYLLAGASSLVSAYLSLFFVACVLFFSIFIIGRNKVSQKLIDLAKEDVAS